jgi:hypothetical protein
MPVVELLATVFSNSDKRAFWVAISFERVETACKTKLRIQRKHYLLEATTLFFISFKKHVEQQNNEEQNVKLNAVPLRRKNPTMHFYIVVSSTGDCC